MSATYNPSWGLTPADRLLVEAKRWGTPLFWGHVNPYGRFDLDMRTCIAALA